MDHGSLQGEKAFDETFRGDDIETSGSILPFTLSFFAPGE